MITDWFVKDDHSHSLVSNAYLEEHIKLNGYHKARPPWVTAPLFQSAWRAIPWCQPSSAWVMQPPVKTELLSLGNTSKAMSHNLFINYS